MTMIARRVRASRAAQPSFTELVTEPPQLLYGIVLIIFLSRAIMDPIFAGASTELFGRKVSLGAPLNATVIGISLLLLPKSFNAHLTNLALPWIFFLSLCGVTVLASPEPVHSFRLLLVLISYMCVFFLPFFLIRRNIHHRQILNVILYSSLIPSFYGLHQIVTQGFGNDELRVTATFAHANIYAFYIIVVSAVLLYRLSSADFQDTKLKKVILVAYGLLLAALLFYTKTRSAWFAATVLIAVYSVFVNRKILPLVLASPFLALLVPGIRDRLLDAASEPEYIGEGQLLNSYEWRLRLWQDASEWIIERPFLGHGGLGSFFRHSPEFFLLEAEPVFAHSVYVQLAFELGIIAPVLFIAIFVAIVVRFLRGYRFKPHAAAIGIALTIIYITISASDNVLDYLAYNWYFYFALGTLLVATEVSASEPEPGAETSHSHSISQ